MAMTRTYATLDVPREVYEHIKKQLEDAGYHHAIFYVCDKQALDLEGIALVQEEQKCACGAIGKHDCPGGEMERV